MSRIAAVGGFGVGMTTATSRVPHPGETIIGGPFRLGPGGKASNQAVAARRLGATVDLVTAIGADDFGAIGQALWRLEGVGTDAVKVTSAPTMVGTILVEPTGENRIVVSPGALDDLTPDDVAAAGPVLRRADVCLVSLEIPLPVAVAALQHARGAGVITVLDPAPAPAGGLGPAELALADVVTPNRAEVADLTNSDPDDAPGALADRLRKIFGGVIVLTLGSDGVLVDDGSDRFFVVAPPPTQVVDTTGAGDAFAGALAVALAERQPIDAAARFAAAAGSHAVAIHEVVPALPTRSEVHAALDRLVEAR